MERREEQQTKNVFVKTVRYLKKNGVKKCAYKIYRKLFRLEKIGYERYRRETMVTAKELEAQRQETFPYMPLISIVVPLYRTPERYLRAMMETKFP